MTVRCISLTWSQTSILQGLIASRSDLAQQIVFRDLTSGGCDSLSSVADLAQLLTERHDALRSSFHLDLTSVHAPQHQSVSDGSANLSDRYIAAGGLSPFDVLADIDDAVTRGELTFDYTRQPEIF